MTATAGAACGCGSRRDSRLGRSALARRSDRLRRPRPEPVAPAAAAAAAAAAEGLSTGSHASLGAQTGLGRARLGRGLVGPVVGKAPFELLEMSRLDDRRLGLRRPHVSSDSVRPICPPEPATPWAGLSLGSSGAARRGHTGPPSSGVSNSTRAGRRAEARGLFRPAPTNRFVRQLERATSQPDTDR